MNKRRLSKQQRQRIAQRQQEQLPADTSPGVIIAHHGKEVDVAPLLTASDDDQTVDLTRTSRCHFRANLPTLVCGDRVRYCHADQSGQTGVVEQLLPRTSLLERPRPYQPPKPVAANIDTIVLVVAVYPEPIASLIDRYLIAAETAQIPVILLFNKHDLLASIDEKDARKQELNALIDLYSSLGYPCYYSSSSTNTYHAAQGPYTAQALHHLFLNKNSILVGQSGVGKSSIINAITQSAEAAIGNISSATTKGKHTTTTASMYFLEGTPQPSLKHTVIDSPGIREFGLWHLQHDDLIHGMPELRTLSTQCRFRDCDHSQTQGCAILAAIEKGHIHGSRIASYRQILDTLQTQ